MTAASPDLAVVYEHPQWFEPLFAALERRGVDFARTPLAGHSFDPAGSPPPSPGHWACCWSR